MEHAITTLTIALENAEAAAPLWEIEGKPDQAALSREHAESYRAAIEKLRATE